MTAPTPMLLQAGTPTPGPGPAQFEVVLPLLVRLAWFLVGLAVVVGLGWYVVEPAVSRVVRPRNPDNPTIQEAISRYVRLASGLAGLVAGAWLAGYGRVLANSALVVAAVTLAVGVAAQAVIGSLVSGLVLVLDPEFNVGDYIEWADGEGVVRSITLRVTRVRTPDGELVTIPNTVLTSGVITRPYGRGDHRVVDRVGVAYEADLDEAMAALVTAAGAADAVLDDPPPDAYVDELGDDAVVVRVHYWIEDPSRRDVFAARSSFAREAKARLEAAGITVSPPSKRELRGRIEVDESS